MANQQHIDILSQGKDAWHTWREQEPEVQPDLSGANLFRAKLSGNDFRRTNLSKADLRAANLSGTDLRGTYLREADLSEANLSGADLRGTYLSDANLSYTNLSYADLSGAFLYGAKLIRTNLAQATLTRCSIYGISAWDVQLEGTRQKSLVISAHFQPTITVDNLEVAQFIYLLLNNTKIRDVINTLTMKAVLILGRFTPKRKAVLDAVQEELRKHNYLPIVLDFEKPDSRDLTETISILAHLSRFIIADLTDPSSVPHELATIAPQCVVPIQPLLIQDDSRYEYALFQDLRRRYDWVLPIFRYQDIENLLASLREMVIEPAERKVHEIEKRT